MPTPACTYRVQLHRGFGFADAAAIAPYLAGLGVSHLYCSPYLQAATGSTHGYDVVDHRQVNVELGGWPGHRQMVDALRRAGLGQVVDIVPNHMAISGRENRWWWEVLEDGPSSRYARYFDIDWFGPYQRGTGAVLVPVLADHYGRVLESGGISVGREAGGFVVRYGDQELPLSPRTYGEILRPAARQLACASLADLAREFSALPHARRTDPESGAERQARKRSLSQRLAALCDRSDEVAKTIDVAVESLNGDTDRLDRLLRRQNYRLAYWRTASEELDYRRFFNIETLVGLRVESEKVFEDTHRVVLTMVADGTVDGLRVDHVDGLRNPLGYLERLRSRSAGAYTVVEKILEPGEELAGAWPVAGTTGYDFLARVNSLFVDTGAEAPATRCYEQFTGEEGSYAEVLYDSKKHVMVHELASEVDNLTRFLLSSCDSHRSHRDRTRRELRDALVEMLACFPVYRTYAQPGRGSSDADRAYVASAARTVNVRRPDIDAELLSFIGELILLEHRGRAEVEFALRFAQVSAPVMAKGGEDTAFYRYNRLVSLNEVGGDPAVFGIEAAEFHGGNARVASSWPDAMLTLSTHDTKRSADVRARVNLLSELIDAWSAAVSRFHDLTEGHRSGSWPDLNAEYLLYQTFVGVWPIDEPRLARFMQKATRESKVHTSWVDPSEAYDSSLASFIHGCLSDTGFIAELEQFLDDHAIVRLGRQNSLTQVALLLTCPGVPDLYQGSELWDLSLVDPDNRRPVDYTERAAVLARLGDGPPDVALEHDDLGAWKMWLVRRLLADRRANPGRYRSEAYEPLPVQGSKARHAVAFARRDLAVVAPRLVVGLGGDWGDTSVELGSSGWTDVLTGRHVDGGRVAVDDLLRRTPVAVLARSSRR